MRIIGLKDSSTWESSRTYIAEIGHREIQEVFDKVYGNECKIFDVGAEIDLGKGFEFRNHIKSAYDQMMNAMSAFEKAKNTLLSFAMMLNEDSLRKAEKEKATDAAH